MIKILLNDVDISNNTEIDFSFVEKLDRELDEGFIIIAHTNEPNQYPMFSVIDIYEDQQLIFSGRISNDRVELSSFDSEIYNHNVSLIEHTKLLEKYMINGKSFTQPVENISGVDLYTLYDVVDILRKTTVFERTGYEEFFAPFTIPQETEDLLKDIIAPEFSFKDVTLRQALDEVANYFNAITRLDRENNITFDKFNEVLNEIDTITEHYQKEQNIINYSTHLTSEVINPVNNSKQRSKRNAYEYYPGKNLWTTLRSEFGQFNFESSVIPTPKPIYNVLEVKTPIRFQIKRIKKSDNSVDYLVEDEFYHLDLTPNVVEKNIFDTLEEPTADEALEQETRLKQTRINTIFYEYGKKGIKVGNTYGLFDVTTAYLNVIRSSITREFLSILPEDIEFEAFNTSDEDFETKNTITLRRSDNDYRYEIRYEDLSDITAPLTVKRWKGLFRIKYIPIPKSIRYEVVRDDLTEVDLFSYAGINQKLRLVDLQSFTNNMKGRVNQISESILQLSHKVKSINNSWKVGDFTSEKFIVTKKEVIAQRDHYIINYELNRNFNKISQFLGIDQEIRQWEIGESGRTLDRDLNYNEYIEVYSTNESDTFDFTQGNTTIVNNELFFSTFDNSFQSNPINLGLFYSEQMFSDLERDYSLNIPIYKVSGGDAFGFYFEMETNASAGNMITQGDTRFGVRVLDIILNRELDAENTARYYNEPVKYTDQIGRLDTFSLNIYNGQESQFIPLDTFDEEVQDANLLPYISKPITQKSVISSDFYVKKDNRERLKFTMLYHLSSKNLEDVIIGSQLSTQNAFVTEEDSYVELRVFNNRTFTTRDKEEKLENESNKFTDNFIVINNENSYIEITEDLSSYDSWALTDADGYPYVMVNSNNPRLVFEFKNKRDGIRYEELGTLTQLLPPELVSVTELTDRFTVELKNNNEEPVFIEHVQSIVQDQLVNPGETVTFTEINREPNTAYRISVRSRKTTSSTLSSSIKQYYTVRTKKIEIDPPIITVKNVRPIDPNRFLSYIDYQQRFDTAYAFNLEVENTNSIPVALEFEFDIGEDTSFSRDLIRSETTEEIEVFSYIVLDDEGNRKTDYFFAGTNYKYNARFRTIGQENPWYSDYLENENLFVFKFERPEIKYTNVETVNIDIGYEKTNIETTTLTARIYSSNAFWDNLIDGRDFIEEKTISFDGGIGSLEEVSFTGLEPETYYQIEAFFNTSGQGYDSETVRTDVLITKNEVPAKPTLDLVSRSDDQIQIRYNNESDKEIRIYESFDGSPFTEISTLNPKDDSGDSIVKTYSNLLPLTFYRFYGQAQLVENNAFGNQSDLLSVLTRPIEPAVEIDQVAQDRIVYKVTNEGNNNSAFLHVNGINTNVIIKPGGFYYYTRSGLTPGVTYTTSFELVLGSAESSANSISQATLPPFNIPQLEVAVASLVSIYPRVKNTNNRTVIATGYRGEFFEIDFTPVNQYSNFYWHISEKLNVEFIEDFVLSIPEYLNFVEYENGGLESAIYFYDEDDSLILGQAQKLDDYFNTSNRPYGTKIINIPQGSVFAEIRLATASNQGQSLQFEALALRDGVKTNAAPVGSSGFTAGTINDAQAVIPANGEALVGEIRDLQANTGVLMVYKFMDFEFKSYESNPSTQVLYTSPERPIISNFQYVTAGPDVVQVSFDVENPNSSSTIDVDANIKIYDQTDGNLLIDDDYGFISNGSTESITYNLSSPFIPSGNKIRVLVTFNNPTSTNAKSEIYST